MLLSYIGWKTLMANPPPSLFTTWVCRENECASQVLPKEKDQEPRDTHTGGNP
jgi:hypothetical protein